MFADESGILGYLRKKNMSPRSSLEAVGNGLLNNPVCMTVLMWFADFCSNRHFVTRAIVCQGPKQELKWFYEAINLGAVLER